ncbi:MAG TPA: ribose 5-phosphate isomerase A [Gemmatimonadaceae bacterium]|nr:ribose 5-phosphate isomerase A [Gemmatimonadaceae bacterium]
MTDPAEALKRSAAHAAVERLTSGMVVGLGTGTTSAFAIAEIGRRIRSGALRDITGIPTSNLSHHLALAHGIPLVTLESHPIVDITIDGADEVDPSGRIIKGAGGALLREKIVATRSRRWLVVIDAGKLVPTLGTKSPLPIEVVRFGWAGHLDALRALGAEPAQRQKDGESPYVTDEGNYLIDARFPSGIADPEALARELRSWPGVVETGLFLGLRPEIFVGE